MSTQLSLSIDACLYESKESLVPGDMIRAFISMSREKGFITYDQILEIVPDLENNLLVLDKIMEEAQIAGISIIETERLSLPTFGGDGLQDGVSLDKTTLLYGLMDETDRISMSEFDFDVEVKMGRFPLPTFGGDGLQDGVNLDKTTLLYDLMDETDGFM